jgi:Protein of unknown function (DUF559)
LTPPSLRGVRVANMTDPLERLGEHDRRRRAGVPTLSALIGPVGLGGACWRRWCALSGRPVVWPFSANLPHLTAAWTTRLAEQRDLTADAAAWAAARVGRPLAEFVAALASKTVQDVEVLLDAIALDGATAAVGAVSRRLLTWRAAGVSIAPERLFSELDRVLAAREGPSSRVVAALAALAPGEVLPAVLLAPQGTLGDPEGWIDGAARLLTAMAVHVPRVPVAMTVERHDLERYLRTARESHATALVREGLVAISSLTEEEVRDRFRMSDDRLELSGSIRRLAADGASVELVEDFRRAAAATAEPSADDGARSEAERFLNARLESLTATVGVFVMNAEMDFSFGRRKAELDFVARSLKIAIEVDGWFHFQDPEAYRRDRRKDWELQRRGYLVLRFLAEDIVPKLEDVLDAILTAVAWRRESGCEKEQLC